MVDIIKPNSKPFSIVAVYRLPATEDNFFCYLESVVKALNFENKEIIIIGDLNCNYLSETRNSEPRQLIEVSEDYQLSQIKAQPTLIDLIFTNQKSRVVTQGVVTLKYIYI